MADVNSCLKSDEKRGNAESKRRKYCCVCKNYRGKVVNNQVITLHRFPARKILQNAWVKRIRTVSQKFQYKEGDDRLCSAHFRDGIYDRHSKENNVPSIFVLQDGRVKRFESISIDDHDVPEPENVTEELEPIEIYSNTPFTSSEISEYVSISLHDYEGRVDSVNFQTSVNKETQTVSSVRTCDTQTEFETVYPVQKKTRTFGTQTDFETKTQDVGIQVTKPDITIEDIKYSEMCMFYTGLPNVDTFNLLFNELDDAEMNTSRTGSGVTNAGRPRTLRLIDEFFLILMRLRLGLLLEDLAQRFHISKSTCSNITSQWTSYLSVKLSSLVPWPCNQQF